MASNSPIIEKLRKLMAHEQSARAIDSLLEAEAFAEKIQNLLTEYKLSMTEIEFDAREEGEPIDWENVSGDEINVGGKKIRQYWRMKLANGIAEVNSCQAIGRGARSNSFAFVGRTTDRELCKVLYLYMVELGEELVKRCAKDEREVQKLKFNREVQKLKFYLTKGIMAYDVPDWANAAFNAWMKDFRESWKSGFADAIYKRLKDRYEQALRDATGQNAIIHIKKDALAVEDFLKGKIRMGRSPGKASGSDDGYSKGKATGNTVNLNSNALPRVPAARRLGA